MNYSELARRLTKRFNNTGAKRLHEWSRTQYGRIVSFGRSNTSLANVDTDAVFLEVEKAINCFNEIKPADFVRWFRLVPAIDVFGKTQACVEPTSAMYADLINEGNDGKLRYEVAIVKGSDLIDIPARDKPFIYQHSTLPSNGEIKGVVLSITDGVDVATLFLPKVDCQHIITIHTETKYRCNALGDNEWDDVLITACFRRIMSTVEAGKWIHAMSAESRANIDSVIELNNKCYTDHKEKGSVVRSAYGSVIAEAVVFDTPTDADVISLAAAVRKKLGTPDEGCDAEVLALNQDVMATAKNKKTTASDGNVVALNPHARAETGNDDFKNINWGVF